MFRSKTNNQERKSYRLCGMWNVNWHNKMERNKENHLLGHG